MFLDTVGEATMELETLRRLLVSKGFYCKGWFGIFGRADLWGVVPQSDSLINRGTANVCR